MRILKYNKGAIVAVQNSANKGYFFIVKEGVLTVDSEHAFSDKVLSKFVAGDSFGLVSALTGHKFLVTVYAATDATLIEIPVSALGSFLKKQKNLALKMLGLLSGELKATHKYLSMVNQPNERRVHPEKLFKDAEAYLQLNLPKYAVYALQKYLAWMERSGNQDDNMPIARQKIQEIGINYQGPAWHTQTEKIPKDEIIFLENEFSTDIYIIKSGTVRLFKVARNQELIIDVLTAGEIFGEMAFIDNTFRMASAVTDTDSIIMRLSKETLFDAVGESIMQKIFESLARRVWFSHQRLVILRIANPITRLYAFIYNLIRDLEIKNKTQDDNRNTYEFSISLTELKKMCGLVKLSDDKIQEFLKDQNLKVEPNRIRILNRKRIEEKVAFYKTRSGQLSAS
jgi:CRP-like cAMP-binding protein